MNRFIDDKTAKLVYDCERHVVRALQGFGGAKLAELPKQDVIEPGKYII